jgi:hypothetical protein
MSRRERRRAKHKDAAAKMVQQDIRKLGQSIREDGVGGFMQFISYEHGLPADMPEGDGDGEMMPITIGTRDRLTKHAARQAAEVWRKLAARYPKAIFYLHLLGYDQDPREIWEIVDAARYVRCFARYAGLDDIDTALRFFGPSSSVGQVPDVGPGCAAIRGGFAFLAGCGVFGEDFKQEALREHKPISEQ